MSNEEAKKKIEDWWFFLRQSNLLIFVKLRFKKF